MGMLFQVGVLMGSVLMIKMHIAIALALVVIGMKIGDIGLLLQIVGMLYLTIAVIGHIRCSMVVFNEMRNPDLLGKPRDEHKDLKEAVSIRQNFLLLGVVWRLSREVDFIKKTANLDFKSTN
jgi:hypothetical protein